MFFIHKTLVDLIKWKVVSKFPNPYTFQQRNGNENLLIKFTDFVKLSKHNIKDISYKYHKRAKNRICLSGLVARTEEPRDFS